MTRDELLARRATLLKIAANPDYSHDLQWLEVATELAWIAKQIKAGG